VGLHLHVLIQHSDENRSDIEEKLEVARTSDTRLCKAEDRIDVFFL